MVSRPILAALLLALAGCTDAATRVAYDIEAGARALRTSESTATTVRHEPSRWPEGCPGEFALEVGQGRSAQPDKGSITVTCPGHVWYTTYHLNFVFVPATVSVRKRPGEAVLIDLEKRGGEIALAGLR